MRPIQSFTGVSWGLNNEISKDQWNCGTHRRKTHLGFGNQVSPHPVPTWTQSYAAISVTELSKRDIPLLKSSNFKSSALRLILSRSAKVLGSLLSREFLFQKKGPNLYEPFAQGPNHPLSSLHLLFTSRRLDSIRLSTSPVTASSEIPYLKGMLGPPSEVTRDMEKVYETPYGIIFRHNTLFGTLIPFVGIALFVCIILLVHLNKITGLDLGRGHVVFNIP